ncbi:MAG TPA: NHL repeat-containing protein [Mucilaginibacter sp.]|nr:NHL repeat-containing protein [Mucilaginibacter sp.]
MKKSSSGKLTLPVLLISLIILAGSCKKNNDTTTSTASSVPKVTTSGLIINLTSTTAQSGGSVSDEGTSSVTEAGVCYSSTNKTPTISDSKADGVITGVSAFPVDFTSDLSDLTANTTYYVRAFATNSSGTAYGDVITFTTSATLSGVVTTVTTFAGSGTAGYLEGAGNMAMFNNPEGIAVDASGKLYVSDSFNSRIRSITTAGETASLAGIGTLGYTDGDAATAQFYGPNGIAVDASGNVFVADFGNNVIRKITPSGVVSTFAGNGTPGFVNSTTATSAEFNSPSGIAVDGSGNLYVADRGNNAIRKITAAGVVTTLAGFKSGGFVNATGTDAGFKKPNGITVDGAGNVFVADQGNSAVRKITAEGVVTTVAGGPSQTGLLNFPAAIALDNQGNIFIADEGGRIMESTTDHVLYILAGSLNVSGFVNGDGASALFSSPQGIAVDANNNIYVADQDNNCIRKLTVKIVQNP